MDKDEPRRRWRWGLLGFVGDDGKVIFLLFFGEGSGMIESGEVWEMV